MKQDIHPKYYETKVNCACGNSWTAGSTLPEMKLDVCSNCHPFYTGKQKTLDSRGRIDKFNKRNEKSATLKSTATVKKPRVKTAE